MQIDAGMVAAGIAVQTAAIAPPMLAPVDPTPDAPALDQGTVLTRPTSGVAVQVVRIPDAETIATMQLASKIPRSE